MKRLTIVLAALALLMPTQALARMAYPTEAQYYSEYDFLLEENFSNPRNVNETYSRKSALERRVDGYLTCSMLENLTCPNVVLS